MRLAFVVVLSAAWTIKFTQAVCDHGTTSKQTGYYSCESCDTGYKLIGTDQKNCIPNTCTHDPCVTGYGQTHRVYNPTVWKDVQDGKVEIPYRFNSPFKIFGSECWDDCTFGNPLVEQWYADIGAPRALEVGLNRANVWNMNASGFRSLAVQQVEQELAADYSGLTIEESNNTYVSHKRTDYAYLEHRNLELKIEGTSWNASTDSGGTSHACFWAWIPSISLANNNQTSHFSGTSWNASTIATPMCYDNGARGKTCEPLMITTLTGHGLLNGKKNARDDKTKQEHAADAWCDGMSGRVETAVRRALNTFRFEAVASALKAAQGEPRATTPTPTPTLPPLTLALREQQQQRYRFGESVGVSSQNCTISNATEGSWAQFGGDDSRCGDDFHTAASEAVCQQTAKESGHAFYSFKQGSNKCVTQASCNSIKTGASSWKAYQWQGDDPCVESATNGLFANGTCPASYNSTGHPRSLFFNVTCGNASVCLSVHTDQCICTLKNSTGCPNQCTETRPVKNSKDDVVRYENAAVGTFKAQFKGYPQSKPSTAALEGAVVELLRGQYDAFIVRRSAEITLLARNLSCSNKTNETNTS